VNRGGAVTRSSWEPETVWRPPVVKPGMSDVLRDATRPEVLGSNELQRIPHPANYKRYQVCEYLPSVTTTEIHCDSKML